MSTTATTAEAAATAATAPGTGDGGGDGGSQAPGYYTPQMDKESPLDAGGRRVMVGLNEASVRSIMARQMYSDPKAGLRELYSNCCKSCLKTARAHPEADPHVVISYDPGTRQLVVEDVDAAGMSRREFEEAYAVLGVSTNFDPDVPGQFGVGMAAYYCLSDVMVLESFSRETGERFVYVGRSVESFDEVAEPGAYALEKPGVRISMTLRGSSRDGKCLAEGDLYRYVRELVAYAGVRTVFRQLGESRECGRWAPAPGDHEMGPKDPREGLVGPYGSVGDTEFFEIDCADYRLVMAFGGTNERPKIRLAGMPIADTHLRLCSGMSYFLNIKNERKYMPTATRDTLTEEAVTAIGERIRADLAETFRKANVTTVEGLEGSPNRALLENYRHDGMGLPDGAAGFLEFLDTCPNFVARRPDTGKWDMNRKNGGMPVLRFLRLFGKGRIRVAQANTASLIPLLDGEAKPGEAKPGGKGKGKKAKEAAPAAVQDHRIGGAATEVVLIPPGTSAQKRAFVQRAADLGFGEVGDGRNGGGGPRGAGGRTLHYVEGGKRRSVHAAAADLGETDICVPGRLSLPELLEHMAANRIGTYRLFRAPAGSGKGGGGGTDWDDFVETVRTARFGLDPKGRMTLGQIAAAGGPVVVVPARSLATAPSEGACRALCASGKPAGVLRVSHGEFDAIRLAARTVPTTNVVLRTAASGHNRIRKHYGIPYEGFTHWLDDIGLTSPHLDAIGDEHVRNVFAGFYGWVATHREKYPDFAGGDGTLDEMAGIFVKAAREHAGRIEGYRDACLLVLEAMRGHAFRAGSPYTDAGVHLDALRNWHSNRYREWGGGYPREFDDSDDREQTVRTLVKHYFPTTCRAVRQGYACRVMLSGRGPEAAPTLDKIRRMAADMHCRVSVGWCDVRHDPDGAGDGGGPPEEGVEKEARYDLGGVAVQSGDPLLVRCGIELDDAERGRHLSIDRQVREFRDAKGRAAGGGDGA